MCTNLSIPRAQESTPFVSARTMDFGVPFNTVVKKFHVGQEFPIGILHPLEHHLKWSVTYGFIGVVMELTTEVSEFPIPGIWDGMNSEGLSVAALWLPGSIYPKPEGKENNRLWAVHFPAWAMSQCRNIPELEEAIETIQISGFPIDPNKFGYHFMAQDANGDCLLIEFKDGQVVKTRTEDGCLTNAPFYEEHIANLEAYDRLSPENNLVQYGQETNGSGMLGKEGEYPGLPGDATPPSRFVRAAKMCESPFVIEKNNPNLKDEAIDIDQQAIGFAWQLLQTVWVPYGTITKMGKPKELGDYTLWAVIRNYTQKHLYFYTAFNPTLHRIDIGAIDFNQPGPTPIPIAQGDWYNDATSLFGVQ